MHSQASIQRHTVYSTPWFEVIGKTLAREDAVYYSLKLADYACIIPRSPEGKYALVRQYRPGIEKLTLEWPSGILEVDESPIETAKRELLEETGLVSNDWARLGMPLYTDTARLENQLHCFLANNAVPSSLPRQPEKGIETIWLSDSEIMQSITTGEFKHSLHLTAFFMAGVLGHIDFQIN